MLFKICLVIFTFALRRSSWGPISIRYDNCTNKQQTTYLSDMKNKQQTHVHHWITWKMLETSQIYKKKKKKKEARLIQTSLKIVPLTHFDLFDQARSLIGSDSSGLSDPFARFNLILPPFLVTTAFLGFLWESSVLPRRWSINHHLCIRLMWHLKRMQPQGFCFIKVLFLILETLVKTSQEFRWFFFRWLTRLCLPPGISSSSSPQCSSMAQGFVFFFDPYLTRFYILCSVHLLKKDWDVSQGRYQGVTSDHSDWDLGSRQGVLYKCTLWLDF